MICGVDEAGKGSVLGPLVVAGVGVDSGDMLVDLGVRDSKVLSAPERLRLCARIREQCQVATVVITASEIDTIRHEMTMNACIARAHADVIRQIAPAVAYVDACDVNPFRYREMVKSHLDGRCEIISEHHADKTYPVVSAASIVAKVVRDREIAVLAEKNGTIGSGYPSDPVTIAFLSAYISKHTCPPAFARRSWKTIGAILARMEQSSLGNFV